MAKEFKTPTGQWREDVRQWVKDSLHAKPFPHVRMQVASWYLRCCVAGNAEEARKVVLQVANLPAWRRRLPDYWKGQYRLHLFAYNQAEKLAYNQTLEDWEAALFGEQEEVRMLRLEAMLEQIAQAQEEMVNRVLGA